MSGIRGWRNCCGGWRPCPPMSASRPRGCCGRVWKTRCRTTVNPAGFRVEAFVGRVVSRRPRASRSAAGAGRDAGIGRAEISRQGFLTVAAGQVGRVVYVVLVGGQPAGGGAVTRCRGDVSTRCLLRSHKICCATMFGVTGHIHLWNYPVFPCLEGGPRGLFRRQVAHVYRRLGETALPV